MAVAQCIITMSAETFSSKTGGQTGGTQLTFYQAQKKKSEMQFFCIFMADLFSTWLKKNMTPSWTKAQLRYYIHHIFCSLFATSLLLTWLPRHWILMVHKPHNSQPLLHHSHNGAGTHIYYLLSLTLHLGPNVRCVVCASTPCSIRLSLWVTKNIRWMMWNDTGNKTREQTSLLN